MIKGGIERGPRLFPGAQGAKVRNSKFCLQAGKLSTWLSILNLLQEMPPSPSCQEVEDTEMLRPRASSPIIPLYSSPPCPQLFSFLHSPWSASAVTPYPPLLSLKVNQCHPGAPQLQKAQEDPEDHPGENSHHHPDYRPKVSDIITAGRAHCSTGPSTS